MTVRGPRLYRMVVRPDRPGRRRLFIVLGLVAVAAVAAAAFLAGRQQVLGVLAGNSGQPVEMENLLDQYRLLRDESAVLRYNADLSREAEEKVRDENRRLLDRVAELEQAVAAYRRNLSPDRTGKGLNIERLELGADAGAWRLRLTLVRTGETDGRMEGTLDGQLTARLPDGTRSTFPLAELLPADARGFDVRYVQEIQAVIRLPDGARPERMILQADVRAPRADRIERTWRAPERKPEVSANAGQEQVL